MTFFPSWLVKTITTKWISTEGWRCISVRFRLTRMFVFAIREMTHICVSQINTGYVAGSIPNKLPYGNDKHIVECLTKQMAYNNKKGTKKTIGAVTVSKFKIRGSQWHLLHNPCVREPKCALVPSVRYLFCVITIYAITLVITYNGKFCHFFRI